MQTISATESQRVGSRQFSLAKSSQNDVAKNRRVMWILNHTTLLEWEVPMLMELGFEVYIPKKLPVGPNSRTATVTDIYDSSLSIPREDLEYLNTVNFYESPIDAKTAHIINQHFGNCISAYIFPGLYHILKAFKGRIFMRAFGHAGTMDYEHATKTIPRASIKKNTHFSWRQEAHKWVHRSWNRRKTHSRIAYPNSVMLEMYTCRRRLYLAAAYQEIIENELPFLKERSLFLPLALPPSIMKTSNSWSGGDDHVLFVCPNIDQIEYYKRIYLQFKDELGSFPYYVAGRQDLNGVDTPLTTNDPGILGYIERSRLDELMRTCSCMFYHSQEPRHLHYHPLEAIVTGMPLLFMSGGLLEKLGGSDQPGMCNSYQEARLKIGRIQLGDNQLRDEICRAQKRILEPFHTDYCTQQWKQTFKPIALGEM